MMEHSSKSRANIFLLCFFSLLLFSACTPTTAAATKPPIVAAYATQVYSAADAEIINAEATYSAQQVAMRATAEWRATDAAIAATIAGADIAYLPTRSALQATIDAARANEAQSQQDIAYINLQIAKARAADLVTLSRLEVVSATNALTSTAALRQAEVDKSRDFIYTLPDLVGRWMPVIIVIVILICIWWMVRAGAARLAGDSDRAMLVLGYPQHLAIAPPQDGDSEKWETREHGNTGNTGNTLPYTGNTGASVFPVHHMNGTTTYLPHMTSEERTALRDAKIKVIHVLQSALEYNQSIAGDPALIARYDKLQVKAEDRGEVCDMLEALNPAAVTIKKGGKDQGTFVTPDYGGSVAALLRSIIAGDVRPYPIGFRSEAINSAEVLNSAINALPTVAR